MSACIHTVAAVDSAATCASAYAWDTVSVLDAVSAISGCRFESRMLTDASVYCMSVELRPSRVTAGLDPTSK